MKTDSIEKSGELISRQEALRKAGRYAAFTAAASIMVLTPAKCLDNSGADNPGGGGGVWGGHGGPVNPPGGGGGKQPPAILPQQPAAPPSGLKDSPWK